MISKGDDILTVFEKKEYLNSYYYLVKECAVLDVKLLELRTDIENVKAINYDDMPKGGSVKPIEEYLDEIMQVQSNLYEKKLQAHKKYMEIDNKINSMGDDAEKIVLKLRYLCRKHWEDIAKELNYSCKHIYRIHGKALLHIKI